MELNSIILPQEINMMIIAFLIRALIIHPIGHHSIGRFRLFRLFLIGNDAKYVKKYGKVKWENMILYTAINIHEKKKVAYLTKHVLTISRVCRMWNNIIHIIFKKDHSFQDEKLNLFFKSLKKYNIFCYTKFDYCMYSPPFCFKTTHTCICIGLHTNHRMLICHAISHICVCGIRGITKPCLSSYHYCSCGVRPKCLCNHVKN